MSDDKKPEKNKFNLTPLGDQTKILNIIQKQQRQEQLLFAVNSAANILLESTEENFETSLLDGMELMGHCVNADRVYIMRNETRDGKHCFVYVYGWANAGKKDGRSITIGSVIPYDAFPDWETRLAQGECINGPMSEQSPSVQNYFSYIVIKSILVIPVFIQGKFWGLFSFTDCQTERAFTEDEVNILRSGALMMVSGLNRNVQEAELRKAHQLTQVLLDAMPFSCQLWSRDFKILDCNEATVKIFKTGNKQTFIDKFYDLSPEYQSDGQSSREKAAILLRKAFAEGSCVFEWMHRQLDGTPLLMEVTLVRIPYGEDYILAAYERDLREYKKMMNEIDRRDHLSHTTNRVAEILLQSEMGEFMNGLYQVMALVVKAVNVDRVRIWKNHSKDGELYCTLLFEWAEDNSLLRTKDELTVDASYSETIPGWEEKLSRGDCVNSVVRDMSETEKNNLSSRNIVSIFVAPVFVRNEFWGFVGYDDCKHERLFTKDEQSIMRSVSLLMTSAWLRNQMTLDIRATAAMQKAVFSNYPGIIWCVDRAHDITLFDGLYLRGNGISSSFFEGKKTDSAWPERWFLGIHESVLKTFAEGRQDINLEINDKIFRIRTTPIYDAGTMVYVVGSFDDVTERTRLQADLKVALKQAQDASLAKSHFLANMSHEMRTPLNAVIGLSELTLEDGVLGEDARINLMKISNAGATLLSTVNDILDISKIEAGKFELIPVDYDIPSLINDTVAQSIMRIGEKPIKFILNISESLPARLHGDDLRVKQVINNLLSNAFKYTKEGEVELKVNCERDGDGETVWMTASVRDTGIGIKKEDITRLFTDYEMMDVESHRKIEGTGLGLTITKNIVEMMGGTITVDSEYGKGSVFTAKFKQKYLTDVVIGAEMAESLKGFKYTDQKRRQNSRMARVNLSYARVLIVDDVATNLDVAKGMLKPYGMQIDCVTSGPEAIDIVRAEKAKYNAILMDHMMPGMDGIEATRIIREEIGTEYAKTVPIIALTANAIVGNEEMFLKKGFQAFISKPIEMSRLDTVIRQWVRDKNKEENISDASMEQPKETPQEIPAWILSGELYGIDTKNGYDRFGNDAESYLAILRSYAVNTPSFFDSFKVVTRENLANYAIAVHGVKGSSRGICAEEVGTKAEALEKAAKQGDLDFVTANNGDLTETTWKVINSINDLLNKMDAESPKPKRDKPDGQALSRLLVACEQYNMDEADSAMKEIDSYEYVSDGGLVQWLKENVEMMNFAEIKEKLTTLS